MKSNKKKIPAGGGFYDNFPGRLRRILFQRRMTQAQLAEKIGISEQAMSKIVNEARDPNFSEFGNICDALNVSADYLMRGTSGDTYSKVLTVADAIKATEVLQKYFELSTT